MKGNNSNEKDNCITFMLNAPAVVGNIMSSDIAILNQYRLERVKDIMLFYIHYSNGIVVKN